MRVVIIGDPHAHPDYDNDRFLWLGEYIVAARPDVVVCMGDFADMASLSSYDKGKGSHEGRRFARDVEATQHALAKLAHPLRAYNARQRAARKPKLRIRQVMCLGNHEDRIRKAANDSPELLGTLSVEHLGYEEYGWEVVPFKETFVLEGLSFAHYFPSGDMGHPISGQNVGRSLITKNAMSSCVGHNHRFDLASMTRPDGTKLHGISAGCYTHPDFTEEWNKNTSAKADRGVILIDGLRNGDYASLTFRRMEWLRDKYASRS